MFWVRLPTWGDQAHILPIVNSHKHQNRTISSVNNKTENVNKYGAHIMTLRYQLVKGTPVLVLKAYNVLIFCEDFHNSHLVSLLIYLFNQRSFIGFVL